MMTSESLSNLFVSETVSRLNSQSMSLSLNQTMNQCAGMGQWLEHSPPTSVARVRFPDSASYVG